MLDARKSQVVTAGDARAVVCDRPSVAGSVTQRACTFCGSRVVLYPISDASPLYPISDASPLYPISEASPPSGSYR